MQKLLALLPLLCSFALAQCSTWTCNVAAVPSTTSVAVAWNTPIAVTGQVRYGLTSSYGTRTTNNLTPVLSHNATIVNLLSDTMYYFQAISVDAQGIAVYSQGKSVHTKPRATHTVSLNWQASTSSNVSGYNLYRSLDQATWSKINLGGLIASTLYADSSAPDHATYYYRATAVDITNLESIPSNVATAVVP